MLLLSTMVNLLAMVSLVQCVLISEEQEVLSKISVTDVGDREARIQELQQVKRESFNGADTWEYLPYLHFA